MPAKPRGLSAAKSARRTSIQRNEGEGNKTAARHYNKAQHAFVRSGKVAAAARAARRAVEGSEGPALRKAEAVGRSKGRSAATRSVAKR